MFFKALLISIFSDACKIQALLPFLAPFFFQKIMAVIPSIGLVTQPRLLIYIIRGLRTTHGKALLFWVAWIVMSVAFSIYPGGSFRFVTENLWIKLIPLFLVLAYGTTTESIEKMIWAFILAVAIFAVAAFVSHGLPRFQLVNEYDPNESALMFVMGLPFIFWKLIDSRGLKKILLGCLAGLAIIGIIQTQSRGGFLALIAVAAVSVSQYKHIGKVSKMKIALVVAAVIGILFIQGGSGYWDRITSIFNSKLDYNYFDQGGRLIIWKHAITMMITHPVFGIGVDTFETGLARIASVGDREVWQAAHNSFLQVGAELGFPGLIAFCIMIFSSVRSLKKVVSAQDLASRKLTPILRISYSMIGSWTGFIVGGFFLSQAYRNLIFLLLSLSSAFLNVAGSPLHSNARDTAAPDDQKTADEKPNPDLPVKKPRKYDRNRYLPY